MDWTDFSGKNVALLGAGKENLSLIPHLQRAGAKVTVCDPNEGLDIAGADKRLGSDYLGDLGSYDYVFRTPGMPVSSLEAALKPLERKPIVTSAVDLLFGLKGQQTVAVTGTKGKGTTSSMIVSILHSANCPAILAGNIGNSIFDSWSEITDKTVIVMEVSSFQLEDVTHSPHTAVVLPISPDHLQPLSERSPNFHKDLPAYIVAKGQITAHQGPDDRIVYSLDSQPSAQIGESSLALKTSVSAKGKADVMIRDGILSIASHELDLRKTALRGDHMFHNAAVACAVTSLFGVSPEQMLSGLSAFKPLPHRMEQVGIFDGVEYVDDSYATAPDATIAALSAYPDKPSILILGGSSKGMDFGELAKVIADSQVKAAILIGQEAKKIEESLRSFAPAVKRLSGFSTFRDAVETAVHQAVSGDVVMLSPACASKDMFKDAADRGEQFKKIIHELL